MKNTRHGLMSQQVNRLSFAIIAGIVMGIALCAVVISFGYHHAYSALPASYDVRKGRRRRHGIVLEVGADRTGTPTLTVLGEDSRVVALTPDTAPDGVMRVGALRVAESVDPHRPRDRDRLVQRLVDALRAGDLEKDTKRTRTRSSRAQARRDSAIENLERLRHEMRSHPCHGCPDREEHARVGRKWSRAKAQAERLQRRIENRTGTIARLFDAVCEVLLELGYLEPVDRGHPERELRVTGAGKVLARIYAERDLLIAE